MEKEEMVEKMFDSCIDVIAKQLLEDDSVDKERKEVAVEKIKLSAENTKLEHRLDSLTHNSYLEIGKILNEYRREESALLLKTYNKCKKWLDDNNLPYEEEIDEEK